MSVAGPAADTRAEVLGAIRGGEKFMLVTHENPDGDALGSLVAMQGVMRALGKDSLMFIGRDEFPLPYEYAFFEFDSIKDAHARSPCGDENGTEPWACGDCDCTARLEKWLESKGRPFKA